jgi:hypothetical protein
MMAAADAAAYFRARLEAACAGCGRRDYHGEKFGVTATLLPDNTIIKGWLCTDCNAKLLSDALHNCSLLNSGALDTK